MRDFSIENLVSVPRKVITLFPRRKLERRKHRRRSLCVAVPCSSANHVLVRQHRACKGSPCTSAPRERRAAGYNCESKTKCPERVRHPSRTFEHSVRKNQKAKAVANCGGRKSRRKNTLSPTYGVPVARVHAQSRARFVANQPSERVRQGTVNFPTATALLAVGPV